MNFSQGGVFIRQETRFIKEIIKSKYPKLGFTIRYKTVKNYAYSSDTIIIKLYKSDYVDDVINLLKKHVSGIGIYKTGEVASMNGSYNAKIANINFTEYIEPDLMEFIEVG